MSDPAASTPRPPPASEPSPDWAQLVERIQTGGPDGMEELYRVFSRGIRFYLCRQLGTQDVDDRVHEVFLRIVQSILRGELRQPERLMGYVRTVVRRFVANEIDAIVQARNNRTGLEIGMQLTDRRPDPERSAIQTENLELALRVLRSLHQRDREVLTRFYLQEQEPGEICHDMALTATQFRLIKSRAKTRFIKLVQRRFSLRRLLGA